MGSERLHPAVQHHVANSLGWPALRPLQEMAVDPLMNGEDAILLAPTAGGKTEAAVFPLFSRMLGEQWTGLSLLYVCPIKALLNNLHDRLRNLAALLGRSVELWHGDVGEAARRQIRREPPDVLLTTPESIEAQLVSRRNDPGVFFGRVRAVVIDEVHAFAGDDRGWHLLGVLSRIEHLAGRTVQRVGLSATVGNPGDLLSWLSPVGRASKVIDPGQPGTKETDLTIDYVGSPVNAAQVISQLHRGRKRLVFCDSRARVEELSSLLRELGVRTFVSHSSLGLQERRDAEEAFAQGDDCVIVATSTLELGIDVGDLDHVIQIDAPSTVASFLQRLGRTGRRPETTRNCLFLATATDALVQCCAVVAMFRRGFVEAIVPPPLPMHVLAQQIMGLTLQMGGITRKSWVPPLRVFLAQAGLTEDDGLAIIDTMLERNILIDDGGVMWFGQEGEDTYGRRHFLELLAVFATEPMISVRHGQREIGQIHPLTFAALKAGHPLALGGRAWRIVDVDWKRRIASVEPDSGAGRVRWMGDARPLAMEYCHACREVLTGAGHDDAWSSRARAAIARERAEHDFLHAAGTTIHVEGGRIVWWTFAGMIANEQIAGWLRADRDLAVKADNMFVTTSEITAPEIADAIEALDGPPPFSEEGPRRLAERMKFRDCLPERLLVRLLRARYGAEKELEVTI